MKIYLLTHQRELARASNTGAIVKACLGDAATIVIWQRTEPAAELITLIDRKEIALLYPADGDDSGNTTDAFANFIILDGTWQEARKMYNRSPYLQRASRIGLNVSQPSQYKLRRNQITDGLSTAECAIALLRQKKQDILAEKVEFEFTRFNTK